MSPALSATKIKYFKKIFGPKTPTIFDALYILNYNRYHERLLSCLVCLVFQIYPTSQYNVIDMINTEDTENKKHFVSQKSKNNLTHRFKKGEVANPYGRYGKRPEVTELAKRKLGKRVPGDRNKRNWAERIVDVWFNKIADGNISALMELLNRTEGKVPQAIAGQVQSMQFVVMVNSEESREMVARVLAGERTEALTAAEPANEEAVTNTNEENPGDALQTDAAQPIQTEVTQSEEETESI